MSTATDRKTRYARSGDVRIAYQTTGDGPFDVVLVPGFVSNVETYWEIPAIAAALERIASFSRMTHWDKRGTGMSDPVHGVATIDQRLEDLVAVLDAAEVERASLFAVSEGAPLALLFAATYPQRVNSIAIYGGYPRIARDDDYLFGWPLDIIDRAEETILDTWGDGALIDTFLPDTANDPVTREQWNRFQRAGASPSMGVQTLRAMLTIDVRPILPAVQAPALIIHRAGDTAVSSECGKYMAEHLPNAEYLELPGRDHVWFAQGADQLIDAIEEFFTGAKPKAEPDRMLATVMFTDIVDSTRLSADRGDAEWLRLMERHDQAVRDQLERYGGREIKTIGDGFMATFDGPGRALQSATAIRDAVARLGIQIRAGIHTGEVTALGDDVGGMAVNIAARVSALAGPGEVLTSSTVKDLVIGSDFAFEPRQATELKGVPGEWNLFAVSH